MPRQTKNQYSNKEIILKYGKVGSGYLTVALCDNGKLKRHLVHRLVAEAFIPNCENKPEVNHDDGDKENCCVYNLYWATKSENMQHAYRTGLCLKTEKQIRLCIEMGKKTAKAVNQYDLQGNYIKTWESATEASKIFKIHNSHICQCCKGKKKTAGGYIWKYKNT